MKNKHQKYKLSTLGHLSRCQQMWDDSEKEYLANKLITALNILIKQKKEME